MNTVLLMRAAAATLLIGFAANVQIPLVGKPSPAASRASPSPPLTKPTPQPISSLKPERLSEKGDSSGMATAEKESFSQLTLFLFASGLALFIALLGWSDQIRGIDNDTKELEQRFLKKTGIDKRDFLDIIKPKSADDQLYALTRAESEGRIKNEETIEVLRTFAEKLHQPWSRVERLSNWKYKLTLALTIILFLTGIISLFTNPTQQVPLYVVSVRSEMIILILPLLLIGLLLVIIIRSARWERDVRTILQSMADKV